MWSLCRTESAFCAIFGLSPKLAYQNEPCLVEIGFQNVPVLVHSQYIVSEEGRREGGKEGGG